MRGLSRIVEAVAGATGANSSAGAAPLPRSVRALADDNTGPLR